MVLSWDFFRFFCVRFLMGSGSKGFHPAVYGTSHRDFTNEWWIVRCLKMAGYPPKKAMRNGKVMMIIDDSKLCKVGVYEYVLSWRLGHRRIRAPRQCQRYWSFLVGCPVGNIVRSPRIEGHFSLGNSKVWVLRGCFKRLCMIDACAALNLMLWSGLLQK